MKNSALSNPWNDRKNMGIFKAFFISVKMLITTPRPFFQSWTPERSLIGVTVFLGLTQVFIVTLFTSSLSATFPQYYQVEGQMARAQFLGFMISPVLTLIATFISAFIFQLCIKILRGQGGFQSTFAVMAFISISGLVMLIPAPNSSMRSILSLLSFSWSTVLMVIGFYHCHRLSWGRAVGAAALGYLSSAILGTLLTALLWGFSNYPRICPVPQ